MRKVCIAGTTLLLFTSPVFAAGPDLVAAEKDVCKCAAGPQKQLRKIMDLYDKSQESGDTSELEAAQEEMKGIIEESNKCLDALGEKYPEIDQDEELQKQVMTNAAKRCPDPVPKTPPPKQE